jgi:hypothetical protein
MHSVAGRGLPGGKSLFLVRPRKRNQKEGRPNIPETSENQACRTGVEEFASLLLF